MSNTLQSTFPALNTERLTLRQLIDSDAKEIFLLRSNPIVNKYLGRQPTLTEEEALGFIIKMNENFKHNTGLYWAITLTSNEAFIGTICLFDFSAEHNKCEIGYELLPPYQGLGYMNEALTKIIEFTFQTLGMETIYAFTHKDNQSSSRLLQKLKFEEAEHCDEAHSNLKGFHLSNGHDRFPHFKH